MVASEEDKANLEEIFATAAGVEVIGEDYVKDIKEMVKVTSRLRDYAQKMSSRIEHHTK